MNLVHISTEKCPICGSFACAESIEVDERAGRREVRTHTNGGRWERRRFACGYELTYSPNMSLVEPTRECELSPEYKARFERRATAKKMAAVFIENLDVDADFKRHLKSYGVL